MADSTSIGWTDSTWPVTAGCRRVSPGCENCYAERLTATRLKSQPKYAGLATMTPSGPRFTGEARAWPDHLDWPLRWRKGRRIFVGDMGDLFHADISNEFIAAVFGVAAACPQHTFQFLTKRPERMLEWFKRHHGGDYLRNVAWWLNEAGYQLPAHEKFGWRANAVMDAAPLPNVHLGVSAEDQTRADKRIPLLLQTPATVRFVSVEPLLGRVDLISTLARFQDEPGHECAVPLGRPLLDWVIVGGESGPGARPCQLAWIQDLVAQCQAAGISVFVKQLGSHLARMFGLRDRKGADPGEWPLPFPQEFPEAR